MIFIVVKFTIKPEHADQWLDRVAEFTEATREWTGRRRDAPLLDLLGEIHRCAELRDRGEISSDEFGRRRREILDRI